jgi:glyoxylase-like metal-dependent hydrolase (beta-lactamase superfamily II)
MIFLFSTAVQAEPSIYQLSDELSVTEIEKDVYIAEHRFPGGANSLLVRGENNAFTLVDTPYLDDATKLLVEWLKNRFGEIELIAINTHFHRDNLGGNGYLIKEGYSVYGSDMTVRLLQEKGDVMQTLEMMQAPGLKRYLETIAHSPLAPPNRLFPIDEGMQLLHGGEEIIIDYPGPGHAPDNVIVYFPKRKILFGGCLIKAQASNSLGNLNDANVEEWPRSVERVQKTYPDSRIVVPGHGLYGDVYLLSHTLKLLRDNS